MAQAVDVRFGFLEASGGGTRLWDVMLGMIAPAALLAGWALDETISARAAARFAEPIRLERLAAEPARSAETATEVRLLSGQGLPFGYASRLQLPDGRVVSCVERFVTVRCERGWRLAASAPNGSAI